MAQSDFYPVIFDIVNSYTRHKVLQRRFSAILQNGYRGEANCPSQCAGLIIKFLGEDIADGNRKIKAVFSTAVLQTNTSSWQTDAKTVLMDVRTIRMNVAIL